MRDLSINDGHVDTSCRDPAIAPTLLLQMFSHMEEEPPQCHRYVTDSVDEDVSTLTSGILNSTKKTLHVKKVTLF